MFRTVAHPEITTRVCLPPLFLADLKRFCPRRNHDNNNNNNNNNNTPIAQVILRLANMVLLFYQDSIWARGPNKY
jgi:hypothetical protein